MKLTFVLCTTAAMLLTMQHVGAAGLEKKLIKYGWDKPSPAYVREHVREMEQLPFDGVIMQLEAGHNALQTTRWAEADLSADMAALEAIEWDAFTDNFIIMGSSTDQDWFSDADWETIESNVRSMAKAARLGGCVGLALDVKAYNSVNPWSYAEAAHSDARSFEEYQAAVRRRGSQFMRAIQEELPGARILTLWMLSGLARFMVYWAPDELEAQQFGLLPSFFNGMLDVADPQVRIIDGNMHAYFNEDREPYLLQYHRLRQRGLLLVDPANVEKYQTQVQIGMAIYADNCFGLYSGNDLPGFMTPEEQLLWFEHKVWWSLYTADEYAWMHSENMNWWTGTDVPPGAVEAVRSAREKIANEPWPGIKMKPLFEEARRREAEAEAEEG